MFYTLNLVFHPCIIRIVASFGIFSILQEDLGSLLFMFLSGDPKLLKPNDSLEY